MTSGRPLFMFDFDRTILCEDSDVGVPQSLGATSALEVLKTYRFGDDWTRIVDEALLAMQTREGKSRDDIAAAARGQRAFPETLEALALVAAHADAHIVSDANDVYIGSFLAAHGLDRGFKVWTNPTFVDEAGRLRVRPFRAAGAAPACHDCPANLCKAEVVRQMLAQAPARPRFVAYAGDGRNDFHPATVLSAADHVLVRNDESEPRALGLFHAIKRSPGSVRASVHYWKDGRDLLRVVRELLL